MSEKPKAAETATAADFQAGVTKRRVEGWVGFDDLGNPRRLPDPYSMQGSTCSCGDDVGVAYDFGMQRCLACGAVF